MEVGDFQRYASQASNEDPYSFRLLAWFLDADQQTNRRHSLGVNSLYVQ